jgi:hypothetical protein
MSEKLPSGETGTLGDPADLPRPEMWSKPTAGAQPVPIHGRDTGGEREKIAERRLPMAWAGIAACVAAAILLGLAVGRLSWLFAIAGLVLGTVGGLVVLKSRLMDAATVGQSDKG